MALSEFQLIEKYFHWPESHAEDVTLGIGDDAAVLSIKPGHKLVVTVDSSLGDVHFPAHAAASDIGYRCLAVNLSDLAAMGAQPRWFTLALSLPESDESWLAEFSHGLGELARAYDCALVGGDTTRGPLSVTIQAHGLVAQNQYLCRRTARPGDLIYVSGSIGDAAAGLQVFQHTPQQELNSDQQYLIQRYLRPSPRVSLGSALYGIANSCIDISDGLLADLNHIVTTSCCGADIDSAALPLSAALSHQYSQDAQLKYALHGGDDYELCFTAAADNASKVQELSDSLEIALHCIGHITEETGIRCRHGDGPTFAMKAQGYQHF